MGIFDDGSISIEDIFADTGDMVVDDTDDDEAEVEAEVVSTPAPAPVVEKSLSQIAAEAAEKAERTGHIRDYRAAIKRAREAKEAMDTEIAELREVKRIREAAVTLSRIDGFKGDAKKLAAVYAKAYPDAEVTPETLLAFAKTLELA